MLEPIKPGRELFNVGCQVDVVTEGALWGRLQANVLRDARALEDVAA
jgi:hypothetical protein